jgi:predicted nucleotidyltransferase
MSLTAEQQTLLDAIRRALAGDPAIEAAWLAGSLGRGGGDAFSDVDVLALVAAGAAETGLRYASKVAAIAEPALVQRLFGGRILNVVTTDWGRFDISFIEPPELGRYDADRLTPLFNRGERSPPKGAAVAYRPTPETVLRLVNEYLRVLGLLVVALGRREYGLALNGIDILRRIIVDLMLEENAVSPADRGGALRRNPLLTVEQRGELDALAPVVADHDGLIAANVALSGIFLPRARRLADQIGMAWPTVFEEATRRHLRERAGVSIPVL